jgi:hypothetical protein
LHELQPAHGALPMLIYVAGPYSAPTEEGRITNTEAAMRAGYEILRRGHAPIIPHLTHFFDLWIEQAFGRREDGEFYMQWDFALLRACDGLIFLGPSPGANRERALATELGIPIYESLNALPEV